MKAKELSIWTGLQRITQEGPLVDGNTELKGRKRIFSDAGSDGEELALYYDADEDCVYLRFNENDTYIRFNQYGRDRAIIYGLFRGLSGDDIFPMELDHRDGKLKFAMQLDDDY